MLSAQQAREQSKSKVKEWVANDLAYLNDQVEDAIKTNDETFVSVDVRFLHEDALSELLKELFTLGYKTHLSETRLLLQWGKPLEDKPAVVEDPQEDEDPDYGNDDDDSGCDPYSDDL